MGKTAINPIRTARAKNPAFILNPNRKIKKDAISGIKQIITGKIILKNINLIIQQKNQ